MFSNEILCIFHRILQNEAYKIYTGSIQISHFCGTVCWVYFFFWTQCRWGYYSNGWEQRNLILSYCGANAAIWASPCAKILKTILNSIMIIVKNSRDHFSVSQGAVLLLYTATISSVQKGHSTLWHSKVISAVYKHNLYKCLKLFFTIIYAVFLESKIKYSPRYTIFCFCSQDGGSCHFQFKNAFWTLSDPDMTNIFWHTKFRALLIVIWPISSSRIWLPPFWISGNSTIWDTHDLCMTHSCQQIGQQLAEIYTFFIFFQEVSCHYLELTKLLFWIPGDSDMTSIFVLTKFHANIFNWWLR